MKYVTSFSKKGYEQYGRRFLETYVQYMRHPIVVYVEDPCDFSHPLVSYRDLFGVPGCKDFLSRMLFNIMHGKMWDGTYDYRYAVNRFCRKHFAAFDAAETESAQGGDWLVWVDADVEMGAPLPDPVDGPFMYYLGRPEWHSCSSYVAWDLRKSCSADWWINIRNVYLSGTVFALPEWHDAFINDWVRNATQVAAVDLAAPYAAQLKGPANAFDYVFSGCHHKKGQLKQAVVSDAAPKTPITKTAAKGGKGLYQESWVKGQSVASGQRDCGARYDMIKPFFANFKRRFSVFDLGANLGYFSFRIAEDFDAVCTMADNRPELIELCRANDASVNWLNTRLSATDLASLAECEQFDVVLALAVLHHFKQNWRIAFEALRSLGQWVIMEIPARADRDTLNPEIHEEMYDFVLSQGELIGYTPSHTSGEERPLILIRGNRSQISKKYLGAQSKDPLIDLQLDFDSAKIRIKHLDASAKMEVRDFIPGVNLWTFHKLNGVYPENIDERFIECNANMPGKHDDLRVWNYVLAGQQLHPIDVGNKAFNNDPKNTALQECVELLRAPTAVRKVSGA